MKLIDKLQLREKLLVLGLLPAAILAIVLSIYFTQTRLNDAEQSLQNEGRNLSIFIAKSSVYGVFTGQKEQLRKLLISAANNPDVLLIELTDIDKNVISKIDKTDSYSTEGTGSAVNFTHPIIVEKVKQTGDIDTLFINDTPTTDIIGHVKVRLSFKRTQQRQQAILLNSLYLTLITLAIIALIARQISQAIGKPILALVDDVSSIRKGEFGLHPKNELAKDEIASLTESIHEMSHEIENHQFQMELRVQEATSDLEIQNSKLIAARDKIIKSAEAKSKFISHMSHEIRTPLNGIIGFLDLLQATALSENQKHLLEASLVSSNNLKHIINEVLDTAQLEAGRVYIKNNNFELRYVVNNTLSILSTLANENNVTLTHNIHKLLPTNINQDPIKLGQILINLLSNAIKFSPNTTVILNVYPHPVYTNQLKFDVIDHGIGIRPENIPDLFKEFTQFSSTSFKQGVGLGLAITKQIIDSMQGSINVKSAFSKGSIFSVRLPYKIDSSGTNSLTTKEELAPVKLSDLSNKLILVADDNEINRELLQTLLERNNAIIELANDGNEALKKANQTKYDLILLDLRMPYKTGEEVLDYIRSDEKHINYSTPTIAVTAHITSAEEKATHKNKFDGYLIKPILKVSLFLIINQLIDDKNTSTPIEQNNDAPHSDEVFSFINQLMSNKHTQPPVAQKSNETRPKEFTELAIFNLNAALKTMHNDKALVTIILTKLFAELAQQIPKIEQRLKSIQSPDETTINLVHKVHGSAAYCGTERLKLAAKTLESALLANDTKQYEDTTKIFLVEAKTVLTEKANILSKISLS